MFPNQSQQRPRRVYDPVNQDDEEKEFMENLMDDAMFNDPNFKPNFPVHIQPISNISPEVRAIREQMQQQQVEIPPDQEQEQPPQDYLEQVQDQMDMNDDERYYNEFKELMGSDFEEDEDEDIIKRQAMPYNVYQPPLKYIEQINKNIREGLKPFAGLEKQEIKEVLHVRFDIDVEQVESDHNDYSSEHEGIDYPEGENISDDDWSSDDDDCCGGSDDDAEVY